MQTRHFHSYTINQILNYIDSNLDKKLSLNYLASKSHYSPYHLHRIFKSFTKESLHTYIQRKRIEKAAASLIRRKEITISHLAIENGFESVASFSKAFKKYYGISPTHLKAASTSTLTQIIRKNGQIACLDSSYICIINQQKKNTMSLQVEIKEVDTIHIACITHIGKSEQIALSFHELIEWGKRNQYIKNAAFKMAMVYHDSYKITAPEKVRHSVSLLVDTPVKASGNIDAMVLPKATYAIVSLEIPPNEIPSSWKKAFAWVIENKYRPSKDLKCFEIYHNNFNDHPEKKCILDLYIPLSISK